MIAANIAIIIIKYSSDLIRWNCHSPQLNRNKIFIPPETCTNKKSDMKWVEIPTLKARKAF